MSFHLCFFLLGLLFIWPSKGLSLEKESKIFKRPVLTENPLLFQQLKKALGSERLSSKRLLQKFLIENSYYQYQIVEKEGVYVVKNPLQTVFIIKGARFWTEKHIRKLIRIDEQSTGPSFYSFVETAIRDNYQKQGFLKVSVKRKRVRKGWREWHYIKISEGPRIKLSGIQVKGLFSRPASEYESFIKNNSSDLIKKGFYSKKDLEQSYKLLLDHLRGEGYLQSKIYSDRVFFKKDRAFITLQLEEGPLILIKDIQIKNARAVPVWEILSLLRSRTQAPLRMETLLEDLDKIEEFYQSKGWLNAKITNRDQVVQYSHGDPYVSILISIDEGKKARVDKISIEGLKKTKKETVLKTLTFKPGEILTSSKKQKSLKALGETGLFSNISWNESFDQEGRFEVEISPRERKLRSLRGSVGFHTERGLASRAWLEVLQRNLFGYGRSLSARGDGQATLAQPISLSQPKTFFTYKVSSRYREVFIPGEGWSGDLSLSRAKNVFKYDRDNIRFIQKTQVSFFINKKIIETLKAKWNLWSFETRSELCSEEDCPENPQRIASSGLNFAWDQRDNIFDPSKGHLNSLALELAAPFLGGEKNISFFRLDSHNHWYWSLFKNYSFSLGLKTGWIQALGGKRHLPVSKAFILGGKSSIRGYEGYIEGDRVPHAGIAPIESANEALKLRSNSSVQTKSQNEGQRKDTLDSTPPETLKSVLTSRYGLISLDFRFPVFEGFKGSLFYDLGAVDLRSSSSYRFDYGHSLGIGLRYQTFLIPIGMDIAYKLPPKTGERDYRLHVSIGW